MRRPERSDYSRLLRMTQAGGIHIYGRQVFQCGKVSHHLAVVTAQKFVSRSRHVNIVRLALGTLLVHELEYWLICWCALQMYCHDVEQCPSQVRRAAFCSSITARTIVAGFAWRRVNPRKGNKRLLTIKAAYIADLRHKLRSEGFPDTIHFHDDRVFRELRCQLVHLTAVSFHAA